MRRRQVLAGSLALVTGGLAGCIAGGGSHGATTTHRPNGPAITTDTNGSNATTVSNGGDASTPGADSGLTDESRTTTAERPVVDGPVTEASLRMTGGGCDDGTGTDEATVAFDADRVTVTGTITGKDACTHPRLAKAGYDPDADELVLLVETYSEGDVCAQCLASLAYEATVRVEGGLPGSVVVHHASRGEERTVSRTDR